MNLVCIGRRKIDGRSLNIGDCMMELCLTLLQGSQDEGLPPSRT